MIDLIFITIAVAGVAGVIVKYILELTNREYGITGTELVVGLLIISLGIVPLVVCLGWYAARESNLTFHEYWNGWETGTHIRQTHCVRDGACSHDYDCDPYTVCEEVCSTDSKGNEHCHPSCHTEWHSCPYVTAEYTYTVSTTLGDYVISPARFPEDPQSHRWRASEEIPDSVIAAAGVGIPSFWQEAHDRIASGKPGPVTKRSDYENYILASDHTILKEYSQAVAKYSEKRLLPDLQHGVSSFYHANKMYFVGVSPKEPPSQWLDDLEYFDAGLGDELQGDLYLVAVKSDLVIPDEFTFALKAHWQNPAKFGKDCLSKNGIVVVVGIDSNNKVEWARAFTGMPLGNELMAVQLRDRLTGVEFSPATFFGDFHAYLDGVRRTVKHQFGILPNVIWGIDDKATRFHRVSMSGIHGGGGFLYLRNEIEPTASQQWWMFGSAFFLCAIIWFIMAAGEFFPRVNLRKLLRRKI